MLNAPTLLSMLLWVGGGIAIVTGTYRLARFLLPPRHAQDAEHNQYPLGIRDMAGTVGFRIAALYGIILALVYAQELRDYQEIRAGLGQEAVYVSEIYADAARLGGQTGGIIRSGMARYARLVVEHEWADFARRGALSAQASGTLDQQVDVLLDLQPRTSREGILRDRISAGIRHVIDLRSHRAQQAADSYAWVFWLPAVTGLILVSFAFFTAPPARETNVLLSAFGGFAGLILFFIYAFSNPFAEPLQVQPTGFALLLAGEMGTTPVMNPALPAVAGPAA